MPKPVQTPAPPLHDALTNPFNPRDRQAVIAEAVARIGDAFEGIDNFNSAGRTEPLLVAVARLRRQNRIPITLDTLVALAERINELSNIVQQSALTAADLPEAGWGVPVPLLSALPVGDAKARAAADPIKSECAECGRTDRGALSPGGYCIACEDTHTLEAAAELEAERSEFSSNEDTTEGGF